MNKLVKEFFQKYQINISDAQSLQFQKFYELLVSENEKYNLTSITEKNDVALKHFLDCCLCENEFSKNATVCDMGSGAGFPAIPLIIMRPDLKFTLVDSNAKKINFLKLVVVELNLQNIEVVNCRAEDFAHLAKFREHFDFATARAVSETAVLVELLIPLLKIGGKAILLKSVKINEEIEKAKNALICLNSKIEKIKNYKIKEIDAERNILVIKKEKSTTGKYPRKNGIPSKNPL